MTAAGNPIPTEAILDFRLHRHSDLVFSLAAKIPVSTIFYGADLIECKTQFEEFVYGRSWEYLWKEKFRDLDAAKCDISEDIYLFEKLDKTVYTVIEFGCCAVLKHCEFGSHCLAVTLNFPKHS